MQCTSSDSHYVSQRQLDEKAQPACCTERREAKQMNKFKHENCVGYDVKKRWTVLEKKGNDENNRKNGIVR